MDHKLNEKNLSTNVIDLIEPSDKIKIDEYLQFLKCSRCHEIMLDPKICPTCNIVICINCKICSHNLIQSRHIKLLLDKLEFKCKFFSLGCDVISKYSDLRQHLQNCKFTDEKKFTNNKETKKNNNFSNFQQDSILNSNNKLIKLDQNIKEYEGKITICCSKCNTNNYSNKKEFIEHYKSCNPKNPPIDNSLLKLNSQTLDSFHKQHENVQENFSQLIFNKIRENANRVLKVLSEFETTYSAKKNSIQNYEKCCEKIYSDEYLNEDTEVLILIEEETKLFKDKQNLIEMFNIKEQEYLSILENNENKFKEEINMYKDKLFQYELEEKWAREYLDLNFFNTDIGEKCSSCSNLESSVKKYFCQKCRSNFCVNTCSKMCKNCEKFVCPTDSIKCKLCHTSNYCENCQKKCFFQSCSNTFCPDCFKKNEHQARNANINCKFFTCERDLFCDCLMTSLYCSKCEKRLCNKCLQKDKDHFPFLK